MTAFAALDVSERSTSIHIVDEKGTCLWRGKTLHRSRRPGGGLVAVFKRPHLGWAGDRMLDDMALA